MRKVLDAWAVLAWLQNERPAAAKVARLIEEARAGRVILFMSLMNLGEVYYRSARVKGLKTAGEILIALRSLPINLCSLPESLVLRAAEMKTRFPISYADAFAVATALEEKAALVTGDVELVALGKKGVIRVERLERA